MSTATLSSGSAANNLPRAYRETLYGAGRAACRIGQRSPAIERLLGGRPGTFITAWNPGSRRRPEGWNRRMNRALAERLRRLPHWHGVGQGRGWHEEHVLVAADPRRILPLARRFRQRAVVIVTSNRAPRLLMLGGGSPDPTPRPIDGRSVARL